MNCITSNSKLNFITYETCTFAGIILCMFVANDRRCNVVSLAEPMPRMISDLGRCGHSAVFLCSAKGTNHKIVEYTINY